MISKRWAILPLMVKGRTPKERFCPKTFAWVNAKYAFNCHAERSVCCAIKSLCEFSRYLIVP